MKWFAVYLRRGIVQRVAQVSGSGTDDADVIYVEAKTKEEAERKGYNLYCAKKKKLAIERLEREGKCRCGRHNDRADQGMKTCSICGMRKKATHEQRLARGADGKSSARDEGARIEANLTRQRDRKSEIRLEVLVEVQKAWQNNRTMGQFTRWLDQEIDQCLKPRAAAQ